MLRDYKLRPLTQTPVSPCCQKGRQISLTSLTYTHIDNYEVARTFSTIRPALFGIGCAVKVNTYIQGHRHCNIHALAGSHLHFDRLMVPVTIMLWKLVVGDICVYIHHIYMCYMCIYEVTKKSNNVQLAQWHMIC